MPRPAPVTIATLPLRSGTSRSLVAVEVARRVDLQAPGDVGLDAGERAGLDRSGADRRGERALLRVVLRRQLRELAAEDPERVQCDEEPEAKPVVVERREDLAGEKLLNRLRQLFGGRAFAHSFVPRGGVAWRRHLAWRGDATRICRDFVWPHLTKVSPEGGRSHTRPRPRAGRGSRARRSGPVPSGVVAPA